MIPNTTKRLLDGLDQSDRSAIGDDSPSLMELSLTSSHEDMTSSKDCCTDISKQPEAYDSTQDQMGYQQAITATKPPVRDVCILNMNIIYRSVYCYERYDSPPPISGVFVCRYHVSM